MHAAFYPVFCDFVILRIAVRLTKWCISLTSAMLFAPVHGGCYIISSVGIEWFERNVMYSVCIYDLSVLAVSRMGFQKKKYLDRGWVGGLSSIQFFLGFLEFF